MFNYREIEASRLDHKVALEEGKPKSWLKSVSAFANSHGGHILFGVTNDTHVAVGLDDPQGDATKIAELISARISPAPRYELSSFLSDDGAKQCIKLSVMNGPSYPYYYIVDRTREAYVRHGDRSELASDFESNNLILKGINKTYVNKGISHTIEAFAVASDGFFVTNGGIESRSQGRGEYV